MKKYKFEYCMKQKCDSCKNWTKCEEDEKVRRNKKSGNKKSKHN